MIETIGDLTRSHYCGTIRKQHIDSEVTLFGWVQKRRDHGGVIFIDLRDRTGLVQVVFNPTYNEEVHQKAHDLRSEYVIGVRGTVRLRPDDMINPKRDTGEIEVIISEIRVLNEAVTPPFVIEDETDTTEEKRLKYRYLDLRRPLPTKAMILRHQVAQAVRAYLNRNDFLEIETPVLTKSTPEGARDYVVPSRIFPGSFFALPQSPQLFKQLLMIAGMDRYYQIVRCFRDEDSRADRQPEFTQIDIELSFVTEQGVMELAEGLTASIWKEAKGIDLPLPFPRITHAEAMARYGSDRPDTRFGLELVDLTQTLAGCDFKVFADAIKNGGLVKAINAKDCAGFSRKEIDDLGGVATIYGAKGMAWIKVKEDGLQSPIVKFFTEEQQQSLLKTVEAAPGDLILFIADKPKVVHDALGALRLALANKLDLIDPKRNDFIWVVDFPMFTWHEEEKRWNAEHHPFTAPKQGHLDLLQKDPGKILSQAYDLVLNGNELAGGSIRTHRSDIQKMVFQTLGLDEQEIETKFGFFTNALKYGTPPHGGIAFGYDRLIMLLVGAKSIREVIAFPKTQKAVCLLTESPSEISEAQLAELAIKLRKVKA